MKTTKTASQILLGGLLTLAAGSGAWAQVPQPWQLPYAGESANGAAVIGLWHFDNPTPGNDASSHGHHLTLRGKDSSYVSEGKFGGALRIGEQSEPGDTRQGAHVADKDSLSPAGAFTLEMWVSPDETLFQQNSAFLVDKKLYHYQSDRPGANSDYLLLLRKSGADKFSFEAQLGFGNETETVSSTPQTLAAGQWYHIALSYNGMGEATIFLNGTQVGNAQWKDRHGIHNGPHDLVIGDRIGSTGQRFLGRIDEVRITNQALRFTSGNVIVKNVGSRTAFTRDEKNATMRFEVLNDTSAAITNAVLRLQGGHNKTVALPVIAAGQSHQLAVAVDTALRHDTYRLTAVVENAEKKPLGNVLPISFTIVPRPLPYHFPIIMWSSEATNREMKDIGFTGQMIHPIDYSLVWNNEGKGLALDTNSTNALRQEFDELHALGLSGYAQITPGRAAHQIHPEFNRVTREGTSVENTDGLFPRIQQYARDNGVAMARTFGDLPAWQGSLIHTEVRDHAVPSFTDVAKQAYREYSGQEIPALVATAGGVKYRDLSDMPASRIIPDEHPILKYYRWYWRTGDGWNILNSKVAEGLKTAGRKDQFTWFDPAVRTPSIYGSGGDVDYINQWTYTYPDPLKIALATDELFAMAGGRPGQKVMNMTQIIWYRSQSTKPPIPGKEAEWEKISPKAEFITISPDHLSQALWLKLARPVSAIAYHGWGSLGDQLGFKAEGVYTTTHIETRRLLSDLIKKVVQPLAPTLLQVGDPPSDVAFLESFSSQMLAGRGTWGWGGGWGADSYLVALHAGLQPQIVYDETIQQKGLDGYKVLFLTHCDVLTQPVADAIKKFQQRGGIVVGDEFLAPGVSPDILMTSFNRGRPDDSKKTMLQKAAELRRELDQVYRLKLISSNPEVVTRRRVFGNSDYIFAVNDNRTFGDYVGQHGIVQEKGLPSQSTITLPGKTGYVYDLINRKQVNTVRAESSLQFSVNLGAGEGNLFVVTPEPAGALKVTAPATATRGNNVTFNVQLSDNKGKPLAAVVPLDVRLRDPQGRASEIDGYYGAANGRLALTLALASNDLPGKWQIEVSERLRGQKTTATFIVK